MTIKFAIIGALLFVLYISLEIRPSFCAQTSSLTPSEPTAFQPHTASVNKRQKKINVLSNSKNKRRTSQDVSLTAQREKVNLELATLRKSAQVGARGNYAGGTGPKGKGISATKFGEGGFGTAGRNRGTLIKNKDGRDNHVDLTGNGRRELNTVSEGNRDKFWANSTRKTWGLDPSSQSRTSGDGTILRNDEFYLYKITQDKSNGEAVATFAEPENKKGSPTSGGLLSSLFGQSRTKKYRCQGNLKRAGTSKCEDQFGKQVGEVSADDSGNVVVFNKFGVPIAKGKTVKDRDGTVKAVVGDGLIQADADGFKSSDCMRSRFNKPSLSKTSIRNIKFTHAKSSNRDGSFTYKWPDCFKMSADMTVDRSIDMSRLGIEFIVSVLPVGHYKCADVATCGKECYYCDTCLNQTQKLDILDNTGSNMCEWTSGGTYRIETTVCPPPSDFDWGSCAGFDKTIGGEYSKKKADIDAIIQTWQRPKNIDQLKKQYFDLGTLAKSGVKLKFLKEEPFNRNPSENDLMQFYLRTEGKEEIVGCTESLVNYNLGGSKVNGNVLLEGGAILAGGTGQFLGKNNRNCAKYDQLVQAQVEEDKKTSGSTGGSGILDKFLGGRGSGSTSTNTGSGGILGRFGGIGRR